MAIATYSAKFKELLSDIKSPISDVLLDCQNIELDLISNYFDLSDSNDTISFISQRKADQITNDSRKFVTYGSSERRGCVTHNMTANTNLFRRVGYVPVGDQSVCPAYNQKCELISEVTSHKTGKTYYRVKFEVNGESKECVCNKSYFTEYDVIKDLWKINRQNIRVGRGIRNILSLHETKFTDSEVETFVNLYKAAHDKMNDIFRFFELVEGAHISHWYNYNNYIEKRGQLGNSCMCTVPHSFFNIYTHNPVCKLLILKSEINQTKLKGRALIWTLDDGSIFMDRVYSINDSDVNLFREYAQKNKWKAKANNANDDTVYILNPDGLQERSKATLKLSLEHVDFDHYPYLDTFKYLDIHNKFITNERIDGLRILDDTGGRFHTVEL